jgi:ABC-type branched-subunit amino acid transport system ATPase component/ABC-type branched-subunit amino acid transport system permease subunit
MADSFRTRAGGVWGRVTAPITAVTSRVPSRVRVAIFAALVIAFPLLVHNSYWTRVGVVVAIYVILANGLNIIAGITGLLDMGFIAFYAIGAYTYALLNSAQLDIHLGFWPSLPICVLAAVVMGVLIGIPSLRVRGDYLAIVTLAFFYIVQRLIINVDAVTRGPNGIPAVSRPSIFGHVIKTPTQYYYFYWIFAAIIYAIALRLMFSRTGRAWAGIRDDEITASSFGVNLPRYRTLSFLTTSAIVGLAGALLAAFQVGVFPENFTLDELVAVYLIVILGGSGNPSGVVVGAVLYTFLGEYMRKFPSLVQWRVAIVSLMLLVVIILLPQGVLRARPRKSKTSVDEVIAEGVAVGPRQRSVAAGPSVTAVPLPAVAAVPAAPQPAEAAALLSPSSLPARGGVPLLSVRDLSKNFGGVVAVDGVSFDVFDGEILGVIGPNGAGKTTVFNLITGIYKPDKGTVEYRGEDITSQTSDRVAARGLARTFQNIRVFPQLSVLDNVMAGAHHWLKAGIFRSIARTPMVGREERTAEAEGIRNLAFFGKSVPQRKDEYVTVLNYADRRRVEIARAMTLRPDLLLLDEPAAGMNPAEVEQISRQIKELRDSGYTIILVEHQMPVVMGVSDRIIVVNKGQVLAQGTPREMQAHPAVIAAYLGVQEECEITPKPKLTTGTPLLSLKGVEASYGPIKVLKGLDIDVFPGEIVCLLGANAAGKSTTIKTILGNVRASAGTIEFHGHRIEGWPTGRIVAHGVALVPEGRRIFPLLTVLDNLKMGGYTVRDAAVIDRGIELAFEQFPILYERRLQRGGTLSGGEQQMLAIARALMTEPRLLCLDEPSMGLSPILVQQVFDIIQKINKDLGTTIFMVEQNASMALNIAHRGYVLQTGRIVAADEACNLVGDEAIKAAYLGG